MKNPPADSGDTGDVGSIPGWGRSPGEGNGYPLQYSYLENPMDRGARQATVHRVIQSHTRLKQLSTQHALYYTVYILECLSFFLQCFIYIYIGFICVMFIVVVCSFYILQSVTA